MANPQLARTSSVRAARRTEKAHVNRRAAPCAYLTSRGSSALATCSRRTPGRRVGSSEAAGNRRTYTDEGGRGDG